MCIKRQVLDQLVTGGHATWEGVHITKDGRKFPVELSNTIFEYGGEKMVLATARDISDRKQAEVALQESERKYRALIENTVRNRSRDQLLERAQKRLDSISAGMPAARIIREARDDR